MAYLSDTKGKTLCLTNPNDKISFFEFKATDKRKVQIHKIYYPRLPFHSDCNFTCQLQEPPWRQRFEDGYGILDYTRAYLDLNDKIIVARRTVELAWVEAVIKMFEDGEEKRQFLIEQVREALS